MFSDSFNLIIPSFPRSMQDMVPAKPSQRYIPRVYGFRVNETSLYYRNRENEARKESAVEDTQTRGSRRSRRGYGRK